MYNKVNTNLNFGFCYSYYVYCFFIYIWYFLFFWGNYTQLLDFVIFAQLIFYVISIVGIFIFRRKYPDAFKVNSIFAGIFIVVSCYIILCLACYKPTYTLPGLLITFAGLPVYSLWNRAKQKAYRERVKNSKYADQLLGENDK